MSRFVKDDTDAIELGDGDIVHIRRRMSYAQTRALGSLVAGKDQISASSEYLVAVLEQNIVRWEGPGFQNGTGPVPVTRAAIDALDPDVGSRLVNEIALRNGLNPNDPLAKTAANSSPPSSGTAAGSPESTPSSASAKDTDGPGMSS